MVSHMKSLRCLQSSSPSPLLPTPSTPSASPNALISHQEQEDLCQKFFGLEQSQDQKDLMGQALEANQNVTLILNQIQISVKDLNDKELLETTLYALQWFQASAAQAQSHESLRQFSLSLLSRDFASYLQSLLKQTLVQNNSVSNSSRDEPAATGIAERGNNFFAAQGVQLNMPTVGKRPTFTDLLEERTLAVKSSSGILEEDQQVKIAFKNLNKWDDLLTRSKEILTRTKADKKLGEEQSKALITDENDKLFLQSIFSFHPKKNLNVDWNYDIEVENQGKQTYYTIQKSKDIYVSEQQDKSISVRKSILGLQDSYTCQTKHFSQQRYCRSQFDCVVQLLSETMGRFPISQAMAVEGLLEKYPYKNMLVENLYSYNCLCFRMAKKFPSFEPRILELIVEKLCSIDVDVKLRKRKFFFSNLQSLQSLHDYKQELQMKIKDEREIKINILVEQLLEYLEGRFAEGSNASELAESVIKIFETKIFPIQQLSFMQYITVYVIALIQQDNIKKEFVQKLISFLIMKSFNCLQPEHISTRVQAWNYLVSLLARENNLITDELFEQTITLILRFYSKLEKPSTKKSGSVTSKSSSQTSVYSTFSTASKLLQVTSQDKIFKHTVVQGLASLCSTRQERLLHLHESHFLSLIKVAFKGSMKSLQYASPFALQDAVRLCAGSVKLRKFKQRLEAIFARQKGELKGAKREIYRKVGKYMPFEVPLYLQAMQEKMGKYFEHLDSHAEEEAVVVDELHQSMAPLNAELSFQAPNHKDSMVDLPPHSSIVLFTPDFSKGTDNSYDFPPETKKIELAGAIQKSRKQGQIFPCSAVEMEDESLANCCSKGNGMLNAKMLSSENFQPILKEMMMMAVEDDMHEVEQNLSCIETEFSISPNRGGLSQNSTQSTMIQKRSKLVNRERMTITQNLKEQNKV